MLRRNRQNSPLEILVRLWHHPVIMSETGDQFSLTREASKPGAGKNQILISYIVLACSDTPDFSEWENQKQNVPETPPPWATVMISDISSPNAPSRCCGRPSRSAAPRGARSSDHTAKYALQESLVDPFGMAVTVCHHPTGASKWNPIEHRLFGEMSKHCGGLPFTHCTTIMRRIAGTRTRTGLRVNCALSAKLYPTKIKVSDDQMGGLDLLEHTVLPEWNYTLFARINRN